MADTGHRRLVKGALLKNQQGFLALSDVHYQYVKLMCQMIEFKWATVTCLEH